ncbi:MAG: hypothetical protein DRJ42_07800 [Deltaproteobacteria bacterium]|nr:MAG: hypothetical protein DRJ42_07800 [Deltaproteobacteria bacterium]
MTGPLQHFTREVDGSLARYHLRVERDGSGILLANASQALRLSETGVLIARALLEGASRGRISRDVALRFSGVDRSRASRDVDEVAAAIEALARPSARAALTSLDDPDATVHRRALSAPLAAELVSPGLGRGEEIIQKLWDVGIPQVRFVLPDGAVPGHLPRLIELAEDLGMITGVRARASDLPSDAAVRAMAMAGLDHLDLLWAGVDKKLHADLFGDRDLERANALIALAHELELFVVAVVPLLASILDDLDDLGEALRGQRIGAMVAYAIADEVGEGRVLAALELPQVATTLEEEAEHFGENLVWAAPEERDDSVSLVDQVKRGPRAAGEACIRIEADGRVIAPTGPADAAGNLLTDPWEKIWANAAFEHWRESVDDPERCAACPEISLCAGGCPKDRTTWATPARTGGAE